MDFSRVLGLLLLLFMSFYITKGKENEEVVFPERLHKTRSKRDLSTLLKSKQHEKSLSIKIKTRRDELIIDLKRDEKIQPRSILLRTYNKNGKASHDQIIPDHCQYNGKVQGDTDSYAYISTCNGLTGTIQYKEGRFDIEPQDSFGAHKFYKVNDEVDDIRGMLQKRSVPATDFNDNPDFKFNKDDYPSGIKITKPSKASSNLRSFELVDVEEQYLPYLKNDQTRYVEMLISVDTEIYQHYNNDTQKVIERVLNAVGQVDKSYSAINIRLVVVAIEIQTNGPSFPRNEDSDYELSNFTKHIQKLIKEDDFKDIQIDNSQFFSHRTWGRTVGKAYIGKMCTSLSTGIIRFTYTVSGPFEVFGHEFGHNMNFLHDNGDCKCLSRRGCFMGGMKTGRPGFSDCNLKQLAEKKFSCINNYPLNSLSSVCGNGIKENDEECDCGTPEMCAKNDPCCKPYDCKLREGSQCSFLHAPQCCNQQCRFTKQGTLCREASSNCDSPEYCTGETATCPADQSMVNGTPCEIEKSLLLGSNSRSFNMVELTPRLTAQYFKIIPKYWTNGGFACMVMEMLGCESSQDRSSVPTSISVPKFNYNPYALCLYPATDECEDLPDGTPLLYQNAIKNDCNRPHMLFAYQTDGTLIHKCSKKKVCKRKDSMLLQVSSQCDAEDAKFERTGAPGWSLKHQQTGHCVGSIDTWPTNEEKAELKSSCDMSYERTKLIMRNIDCQVPLGFESGQLPSSAFTAGSTDPNRKPVDIRPGGNVWCALNKNDGSWFQVDFGKVVEVRYISMAGSYWNQVYGYHVMFSNDGLNWKFYKETGANTGANSYCFEGTCSPSYDAQCKDLWSTRSKSAPRECWYNLNTNTDEGFGTCSLSGIEKCSQRDVMCGQLQCSAPEGKPVHQDFGATYAVKTISGKKCSVAKIIGSQDEVGLGMVKDGTKCGEGKICINQKCRTPEEHGMKGCSLVGGKVCHGRGYCLNGGVCFCSGGYDPKTNCATRCQSAPAQSLISKNTTHY